METTPTSAPPTTLNYALTFFKGDGTTENFLVTLSGSSITDSDGNPFSLPGGVTIDKANGLLMRKGQIVGMVSKARLLPDGDLAIKMREDPRLTDGSMSSGKWSGPAINWPTLPAASGIPDVIGHPDPNGPGTDFGQTASGRRFATVTLDSAGAPAELGELIVTPPESPFVPELASEGGGGGGGGEEPTTLETPINWDPISETNNRNPAPGFVPPPPSETLNNIGMAGGMIGGAIKGLGLAKAGTHLNWFGKGGTSVLGAVGVAFAAFGVFASVLDMFRNGLSWKNGGAAITSVGTILLILGLSNPVGWIIIAAAILVAFIVHLLTSKQDNDAASYAGGVTGDLTTLAPPDPGWTYGLPVQNVFTILAGVTALGIGVGVGQINLTAQGPAFQQLIIAPSEVPTVMPAFGNTLQKATGKVIQGDLMGKVFIKVGDGESTPDKVVYVTKVTKKDGTDGGRAVNMVSMNTGGYIVNPTLSPNDPAMLIPFFMVSPQTGAIQPNPAAQTSLVTQNALVRAANGGLTPGGAKVAVDMAAQSGHAVLELPSGGK